MAIAQCSVLKSILKHCHNARMGSDGTLKTVRILFYFISVVWGRCLTLQGIKKKGNEKIRKNSATVFPDKKNAEFGLAFYRNGFFTFPKTVDIAERRSNKST